MLVLACYCWAVDLLLLLQENSSDERLWRMVDAATNDFETSKPCKVCSAVGCCLLEAVGCVWRVLRFCALLSRIHEPGRNLRSNEHRHAHKPAAVHIAVLAGGHTHSHMLGDHTLASLMHNSMITH